MKTQRFGANVTLFVLASLFPAIVHGQPKRVPIIVGNSDVRMLLDVDGTVKVWGQLRDLGTVLPPGEATKVTAPRPLPGFSDIVDAAVGGHFMLLKRDGTVLIWGGTNGYCQMGTGNDKAVHSPVLVPGLRGVKQVATKGFVSGAVLEDGSVWMWGNGRDGLMANGLYGYRAPCTKVPTKVEGLSGVKRLVLDDDGALVLKDDGTVWGWGKNAAGEFCDGTTEPHPRPIQLKGIANAVDIALSRNSYIVLADATLLSCGTNSDGEAWKSSPRAKANGAPFRIPGLTGVRSVHANGGTVIVQLGDGTLVGWGNGYWGSLGDGRGDRDSSLPHAPIGVGPVLAHYMVGPESYAIRADGTVLGWGISRPPNSSPENILTPTPVFTVQLGQ